jgi:hypothetical protein
VDIEGEEKGEGESGKWKSICEEKKEGKGREGRVESCELSKMGAGGRGMGMCPFLPFPFAVIRHLLQCIASGEGPVEQVQEPIPATTVCV